MKVLFALFVITYDVWAIRWLYKTRPENCGWNQIVRSFKKEGE